MKVTDITLGLRSASLEDIASAIHTQFGYAFVPRFSSYLGGDYYASVDTPEKIVVQANRDGDSIAEVGFSEFPILLLIDSCSDTAVWKSFATQFDGVVIREDCYDT